MVDCNAETTGPGDFPDWSLVTMLQVLPFRIVDRCGLDIDRVYPLPRRALALVDMKLNGKRYVRHCRKALDHVHARFDVRCGPLPVSGARQAPVPRTNCNRHQVEKPPHLTLVQQ